MATFRKRPLMSDSSCGLFDKLPKEIQHYIFDFLPLTDVGTFSLASEGCRLIVADWIPTKKCLSRALIPVPNEVVNINANEPSIGNFSLLHGPNKLSHFAVLVKRMTCLLNTRERIKYAFNVFDRCMSGKLTPPHEQPDPEIEMTQRTKRMRLSSISSEKNEDNTSKDWKYTIHVMQFFTMLHTFIRGWDESEFPLLLEEITKRFQVKQKVNSLFECCVNGQDLALATEMELRLLMRCLAWDIAGNDYGHRAAWILAIIKYYVENNPKKQAMVFLLMFGPPCQDAQDHYDHPESLNPNQTKILMELNNHTDWERFADNVPEDFYEGKEMFYTLAQALCSCLSAGSNWKNKFASQVLEEMFCIPQKWKRENVAGFLLFCSEGLILHFIQTKLRSGKQDQVKQAGSILVDMVIISHKFDNTIETDRGIGKVFDIISAFPKSETQTIFFKSIWESITKEMDERVLELEDGEHIKVLENLGFHLMRKCYSERSPKAVKSKQLDDTDVENEGMEVEE